jgi:hypothetical protein
VAKESCGSCGRVVQRGDRFCPSCGAEILATLPIDIIDDDPRKGSNIAMVDLRPSRRPLVIVGVAATVAALILLAVTASRPAPVTPAAPLNVAEPPTTVLPTSTVPASTITEPLLASQNVTLPAGLHGHAWFLLADGSVERLDLTTGTMDVFADAVIDRIYGIASENAHFVVLDDGIMVWVGGRAAMVPFSRWGQAVAVGEDLEFITGGDRYVVLRRQQPGSRIVQIVVDSWGSVADLPDLGSVAAVVGVAGERLVVQAADQIGLLDLTGGTVTPVARGSYVASNRWGLSRLECPQPPTCELHTGPWSSLDQRVVPASFTVPTTRAGTPQLSADGSQLALPSPVALQVIDTVTGRPSFPAGDNPKLFALGPDGSDLLTVTGGQTRLERPGAAPIPLTIGGETFRRELVGVALTG